MEVIKRETEPVIRNPKRDTSSQSGKAAWYDFYASYSPGFVEDVLHHWSLPCHSVILDPWNGSGTTTQVAVEQGYRTVGFDINPVMVVVAKARQLEASVKQSLESLGGKIITKARQYRKYPLILPEPLELWLFPEAARAFRSLERSIQDLLIDDYAGYIPAYQRNGVSFSSLCAFYYLALFRTVRQVLGCFRASNPTWTKKPVSLEQRVNLSAEEIFTAFKQHILTMKQQLGVEQSPGVDAQITCRLDIASSEAIPLETGEIGAVITSPPYCTRIDYVVSTRLELAIMGYSDECEIAHLRSSSMGTPTITGADIEVESCWGPTCVKLLDNIYKHPSKASRSYYFKTYVQYFRSLYNSLQEIDRTLKPSGRCALVVQDSHYKNLHVDLPRILLEMAISLCWEEEMRVAFPTRCSMAGIHSGARKYRNHSRSLESAILLNKGGRV